MSDHLIGAAEVAEILGVSRQRVAQLQTSFPGFPRPEVEVAAGRIWKREAIEKWAEENRQRVAILRCSFCGKGQDEVRRLVHGPGHGVNICDQCADSALSLVIEGEGADAAPKVASLLTGIA